MSRPTCGTILSIRPRTWILPGLLLFFLVLPVEPSSGGMNVARIEGVDYLPLDELIACFNINHSFDMISQRGKLYLKSHYAVYGVGMSVILLDGELCKSSNAVRRKTGKVLVPIDAGEQIIKSFIPGVILTRSGSLLNAEYSVEHEGNGEEKSESSLKSVKERIGFIVIDPGHGGKDPGALGKGGLQEKDITLKVAKYLEKKISTRLPDVRVMMTRNDDRFVELSRRTEIANRLLKKRENGLFLSIHVNSALSGQISGFETYFLSQNPTNDDARSTAALENNVIILEDKSKHKKGFEDVDYIEALMITTQIQKESSALAASIQEGLAKSDKSFGSRGVKKADFFVLRGVLMPAALIEIGYISNKKEAQSLKKENHREVIAEGIADGVAIFIKKYNNLIKIN
jgi:N-acetylmuramoyl-L-alanine amidase